MKKFKQKYALISLNYKMFSQLNGEILRTTSLILDAYQHLFSVFKFSYFINTHTQKFNTYILGNIFLPFN